MHLGLTPFDFSDLSASSLVDQAQFAESLGYQSFWLPENHFNPGAVPDPLMLLAAVAAGTTSMKLGTTSFLLTLRHPLQAAEQVAVLDQLSGGRVILGVGRGVARDMLRAFNVAPRDKRKIFEWSLKLMLKAWGGEPIMRDELQPPVSRDGSRSQAQPAAADAAGWVPGSAPVATDEGVVLNPLPVQQPNPPVWVAAFGPKALAQAGRLMLPYLASPMETLTKLCANRSVHVEATRSAGGEAVATVPVMRTVYVTSNPREAARLKEEITRFAANSGRVDPAATADDWTIIGDHSFVRDKFAEYVERMGVTHMVATRLRIGGVDGAKLRASLADVADISASVR